MIRLLLLALCFIGFGVYAGEFSYQGKLKFDDELTNGQYDLDFEIYKNQLSNESVGHISLTNIRVIDGVFTAKLGLEPDLVLHNDLWLEVSIRVVSDTTQYQQLLPRQLLSSTNVGINAIAAGNSVDINTQVVRNISLETIEIKPLPNKQVTDSGHKSSVDDNDNLSFQANTIKAFDQSLIDNLRADEYIRISHLHDSLREIIDADLNLRIPSDLGEFKQSNGNRLSELYSISNNRILIDITTDTNPDNMLNALESISGIKVNAHASTPAFSVITISAFATSLFEMSQISGLKSAVPVMEDRKPSKHINNEHINVPYSQFSQGVANNQAEEALEVVAVRRVYNLSGTGISLGVLSDSVDQVNGGISDSQASLDLPGNSRLTILNDNLGESDEGRAMMELIHDISPDLSKIGFATAFGGEAVFANNITSLGNAGMGIIVDDVTNFNEPFYQDGVIAQAVDTYVSQGGIYFSSAGNNANQSYESVFSDTDNDNFHNYSGNDELMDITIAANSEVILILQWAQPWGNATTDLDLEIRDSDGNDIDVNSTTNNIGGNPYEIIRTDYTGSTAGNFKIAVKRISGSTTNLTFKLLHFRSTLSFDQFTNAAAGTISPHAGTPRSFAIGAAPWYNRTVAEPFSSQGSHKRFFDASGNPVGPFTFEKPDFMGVDAVNTSFFGREITQDPDNLPNFFGTSASAPNVAAVAALMLQVAGGQGSLDYLDIKESLKLSAIDLGDAEFDTLYGHGLINALGAVTLAKGASSRELYLYLNQFGDANLSDSLVSNSDVDRIMYSSNVSGPTTIDVTEIDITFDPMVAVFVPDFDLRVGVDYNGGSDADDARFIIPNAASLFPYQFEVLSESEITEESDFIAYVDAPNQNVIDRTGFVNGSGVDFIASNLDTNGTSKYYKYTPPYNSSLEIRVNTNGLNGIVHIYDDTGGLLVTRVITDGFEAIIILDNVLAVSEYTIQVTPYRYIGTGDFTLDIDFDRHNYTLMVNKTGDGEGVISSGTTAGIECGVDCDEVYVDNTLLTLEAIAEVGHTFIGWSGNCSEINEDICTVHMLSDNTVTAEFQFTDVIFSSGFD